ncbi:SMP-30/gluconolactonase/LRE family protein [Paraburkholderia oxyphila]|uniref:SMP-30/gluconolactonase/LRE family protein n=1 Tax=Paraburkholderia oxyphila TaxID=614212 RepID=UPI0009FE2C2F|nr:SMP-30/gluconolactonase/LRE family protein [Paraburkholderia oxyphila]
MSAPESQLPDEAVRFATGLGFIEGPVWDHRARTLSVVSINHGCVYTLDAAGNRVEAVSVGGGPNGLVLSSSGLLIAQNGGIFGGSGVARPGVQRIQNGRVDYVLDQGFLAPNDLAFGPDGRLYVTDPATDRALTEPTEGRLLACNLRTGECETVVDGRLFPNGLAFEADGEHLLLAQTYPRLIERLHLTGGGWTSEGVFCHLTNGRPDGMAIDEEGNVWICTPGTGGVEIFDRRGQLSRRIDLGSGTMTTNICFGGDDRRDVFITAAGIGTVIKLRSGAPGLRLHG